ncbi:MAG: TlpA family protein disulfide reductase [Gemmatimonadota bacterium]|nr:TlpA family protein disulfide reductase [Gemmatimonadota bacterium]
MARGGLPPASLQGSPQSPHFRARPFPVFFADPRIKAGPVPVSSMQVLRRSICAAACMLTLLATPATAAPQASVPLVAVGQVLPDVVMAGLNGPHKPLSGYRGRPLIINVWASWCGPCRKEAASLERLAWSKAGSRYTVIGISTDDDRNAALKWLRHSNATISHYIDTGPRWTLEHMLGASTIPVTVLVDAQGRVVARFRGARDWDSAESIQLIERAFAGRGHPAPAR